MQIARAAEIHWRICTEPWQLHDTDPRNPPDPLIPACHNCGTTTAPLLTRAGRLLCRSCWCPLGLDDDKEET